MNTPTPKQRLQQWLDRLPDDAANMDAETFLATFGQVYLAPADWIALAADLGLPKDEQAQVYGKLEQYL